MMWAVWIAAFAAPTATLTATVSEDLRSVSGTLTLDLPGITLSDPLARLPEPPDDRLLLRTYPNRPNQGSVEWTELESGTWAFTATFPRRYGATGSTREGLMANGAWYPQPSLPDQPLPVFDWTVEVTLPEGRMGALGDRVAHDTLLWTGTADRVSLAVLRRGQLTHLEGEHWSIDLLTPRRPRSHLRNELPRLMPVLASEDAPLHGALVEGPLRQRLAVPGAGLAYVSDRAFRLTGPVHRYHRVGVIRGLSGAWVAQPDAMGRSLAGAAIAQDLDAHLTRGDADEVLSRFSWIPSVHWLLASGRMPFYGDLLVTTWPQDALRADLTDAYATQWPGPAILAQIDGQFGEDSARSLGAALRAGTPLREAERRAGLPDRWLELWRQDWPWQDYRLSVTDTAVTLTRDAPEDATIETVTVRIDDTVHTSTGGPRTVQWDLESPARQVVVDPQRNLLQASRVDDSWPRRYTTTWSAGISTINLTRGQVFGAGVATLRKQYDTHNLWRGTLYNSQADLVGARIAYRRAEGQRQDGFARPHRLSIWVGSSLLNPGYANTEGLDATLGGGLGYVWDTRVHGDFPLRGRRLGLFWSTGTVPVLNEQWSTLSSAASGVVAFHPRVTLAGMATGAVSFANVPHRRLPLGGISGLRSLPALSACGNTVDALLASDACQETASSRALAAWELRTAPLRNVSVPGWLVWGSELQLSGGLEGLVAHTRDGAQQALGATAGITGVGDIFGAEPYLLGLTAGWPLVWSDGIRAERRVMPELYLRWTQAF